MIQEHYLRAIINGSLNTSMQKNFVHECHELVMGFVELRFEKELRNGGEITNILQDLAWNSLAVAFESNELLPFQKFREKLIELVEDSLNPSYEDLLIATRKILFQVVNDLLFDHFGKDDPDLTKLIRLIKSSISKDPDISIISRDNKMFVCFWSDNRRAPFEEVSPDLFQIRLNLRGATIARTTVMCLMQLAKEILCETNEHNMLISLHRLASCFKDFYASRSFN